MIWNIQSITKPIYLLFHVQPHCIYSFFSLYMNSMNNHCLDNANAPTHFLNIFYIKSRLFVTDPFLIINMGINITDWVTKIDELKFQNMYSKILQGKYVKQ